MYGKIFDSMFRGSMYGAGSHVFAVWTWCIVHADYKTSMVEIMPRVIAGELGESVEKVKAAIEILTTPDGESRKPEENGRRMVYCDEHLYRIVNLDHYRKLASEDDRREYQRNLMKKRRATVLAENANNMLTVHSPLGPPSACASSSVSEEGEMKGGKQPEPEKIDWNAVMSHWNMLARKHGLPELVKITDQRKAKYRSRTEQGKSQAAFWKTLETELALLDGWARGESDRHWVIDFDYIIRSDATFTKLSEGGFRRGKGIRTNTKQPQPCRLDLPAPGEK